MKATRFPIIAGLTVLWLGVFGPATATEDGPYPVWWSPVLELDSLDAIDARLAREIWPGDSEGMRLMKIENDTRVEVRAVNCIDLERLVDDGYYGIGRHGFWLQQYQLARCHAIEMLRTAMPAQQSFLRDFSLDVDTVDYLPAIMNLSPLCEMMCREIIANNRRIPLRRFHDTGLVQILDETVMDVWSPDWKVRITILARADFNHDGLEDMLALSSGGSISGRGAWADVFLLTREKPGAVLYDLNADKGYCPDYQCAEVYDYPKTLRETNPQPAE
ncbi:MAG: hypothetical protein V3R30_05020 [Kiloniellales bacterium]